MSLRKAINRIRKNFPIKVIQRLFFISIIILGIITGIFIANAIITFNELKDIKPLENYSKYSVPTKVYDIKNRLITEFYLEKRELITYKDLPENLIKAIIAIEDNNFFNHRGFNIISLIKGAIINPLTGKRARGGSTLTQQLAKGLFTTGERSIMRKLVELWYTFQIEKKYSKEEILELYFNQVYFGHGCYGVQAAAKYFFDKNAKDLDLAECSLLAGLVQLPTTYSPIFNPYKAQGRHRSVLQAMVNLGFISQATADEVYFNFWKNYSSVFKAKSFSIQTSEKNLAPFFTEYIRIMLQERYGIEKLYSSGLNIYTTLDLDKQRVAVETLKMNVSNEQIHYENEIKQSTGKYRENYIDLIDLLSLVFGIDNIKIGSKKILSKLNDLLKDYTDILYLSSFVFGLDEINTKIKSKYMLSELMKIKQDQIECALISINPKNGYIEAMVGGKEFNYVNQFNRAMMARRQTGSLFKPIYYSIALDKKLITPASVYDDKPIIYQDEAGNFWSPRNYEGSYRGKIRVRTALQYSVNVVSVQIWDMMLKTLGYNYIMNTMANYFGIPINEAKKRINSQLSFALGVGVFTPYEIARAFCVFANDGVLVEPIAILKVKDRLGRVIDDFEMERDLDKNNKKQLMSPTSAYLMQDILKDVLYHGTGASAAKNINFTLNAGGKTGTTPNWKDAWFAGFTKNLVTVVWFGFDDARKSLGRHRSAAVVAAPAWMKYMKEVVKPGEDEPFIPTQGIVKVNICSKSGLLPNKYCPHIIEEFFIKDTIPTKVCDIHNINNYLDNDDYSDHLNTITNQIDIGNFDLDILENKIDIENKYKDILDDKNNIDINLGLE